MLKQNWGSAAMLKTVILSILLFLSISVIAFGMFALWLNFSDERNLETVNWRIWNEIDPARGTYDPLMVAHLPAPVQRYFNFMIAPDAQLRSINRIEMVGEFGLGDANEHSYYPFTATQYNAAPTGFTWALKTYDTPMSMNGSDMVWDEQSWTKFWLLGVLPVARAGGDEDYLRSGVGRMVVEMAAWSPVSLLPQFGVEWEELGDDVIRAKVNALGFDQIVDIKIDTRGAPIEFLIPRWSNANPEQTFKLQPFGGIAHAYATYDGITIVSDVEAGNHFGTPDYFAFFKAKVTALEYQPAR